MTEPKFDRSEIATAEQLSDVPPTANGVAVTGLEQPAVPPALENPAAEPPPVEPASDEPIGATSAAPQAESRASGAAVDGPSDEPDKPAKSRRGRSKRPDSATKAGDVAIEAAPAASPLTSSGSPPAISAPTNVAAGGDDENPFSPKNLAISQNFSEMTVTRRLLTSIPVGKPDKEAFVRTSPDPNHWISGSVLLLDSGLDKEFYWVVPAVRDQLTGEPCLRQVLLVLGVTRRNTPFFWPISMPDSNGRSHPSAISQMEAATAAKSAYVRIYWSKEEGDNIVEVAKFQAQPVWPTESLQELLSIAFRDRVISSLDHPAIRQLRGQE